MSFRRINSIRLVSTVMRPDQESIRRNQASYLSRASRRQWLTSVGLCFAALSLPGSRARAQQPAAVAPDADATFSADVKVVNVFATVRDKKNQIVHDLTKDDFVVLEDGRPQAIRYFSRESDLPLTVGLM